MRMGWMGTKRALLQYLSGVGADTDGNGHFLIRGELPVAFLGEGSDDNDIVLTDNVECCIDGQWSNLAHGLNSAGQGVAVKVF